MHLGESFGVEAKLYPPPGLKRGEAMKWIVWSNVALAEAAGRLSAALPSDIDGAVPANSVDWVPPEQRSADARDRARMDIFRCLGILNEELKSKDFLLGDYSLADTHIQGFVGWIGSMQVDFTPFPESLHGLNAAASAQH